MRLRILLVAVSVLFLSSSAWAENNIFGGYSFLNVDGGASRETFHGWLANANIDVADRVGVVGDVSGFYEMGAHIYTYMGGVRFNGGNNGVNPFGQAMFGGVTIGGGGGSVNGVAMGFGGGVDVEVANRVSVRAVQFDWVPVRLLGVWDSSNIRLGWGIVFNVD